MIPAGWTIERNTEGEILVCAPGAKPGGMYVSEHGGHLPARILFALANALLSQRGGNEDQDGQAASCVAVHPLCRRRASTWPFKVQVVDVETGEE